MSESPDGLIIQAYFKLERAISDITLSDIQQYLLANGVDMTADYIDGG